MADEIITSKKILTVNTEESIINWTGFKPLGKHYGTLKFKGGTITLDENDWPIAGVFTFDMNSIIDMDLSGKMNEILVDDLKGTNFFDILKYPESKLNLISINNQADEDDEYEVKANLTIKSITNEINFKLKYNIISAQNVKIEMPPIMIDRTKWGINYGSKNIFKKLTQNIINDDFEISAVVYLTL